MHKYQSILVIYLLYYSLEASDDVNGVKKGMDILTNEMGYITSYPEHCTTLLDKFARSAANFTLCSIKKARPIKLCENCIDEYIDFSKSYKELVNDVNGTTCRVYFLSQDRFDVILEYYDHIMAVWDKGHCNDCYDFSEGNPTLSNNTLRFNKMAMETKDCIFLYQNNSDVCALCMDLYLKLNKFYGTLSKDSIGVDSVCMDTVDLMNSTRSMWSKELNCCKMRQSPEIIFLCCTGIISLLPFFYYIVIRFYGPIKDLPNVLKELRFKQSLMRSVQGRIN